VLLVRTKVRAWIMIVFEEKGEQGQLGGGGERGDKEGKSTCGRLKVTVAMPGNIAEEGPSTVPGAIPKKGKYRTQRGRGTGGGQR